MRCDSVVGDTPGYLSRQLITYLGNKRALLPEIDTVVCGIRDKSGGRSKCVAEYLFIAERK